MSVVKPVREIVEPDEALWRLSHELPSQAIGPCTRCATSTIGCSAILAPSNAQPPAAAPGVSCLVQPFLRSFSLLPTFLSQPGSSKTSAILALSDADIRGLLCWAATSNQWVREVYCSFGARGEIRWKSKT